MIWFTSDLHVYHSNVIGFCNRPYESVEIMNESLVAGWNQLVRPDDTVWCMGDFSLALRPVVTFTPRLIGTKKLVAGNHDWVFPANKKNRTEEKRQQNYKTYHESGWSEIHITTTMLIDGQTVNMCHLPYRGDSTDSRYEDYRLEDDGRFLLCGHVHQHWLKKGRMINCGVDVWGFKPVSLDQIISVMKDERTFIKSCTEL